MEELVNDKKKKKIKWQFHSLECRHTHREKKSSRDQTQTKNGWKEE